MLIISCILFADDLAVLASCMASLRILMDITFTFFKNHRMDISEKKSKLFLYSSETGETHFIVSGKETPLTLEHVITFKYLGVPVNSSPRNFYTDFNTQVKQRSMQYLTSIKSLSRSGPDQAQLASSLWTSCAIHSALYGVAIMPITEGTLNELEVHNREVARFILQLPEKSCNAACYIDAGLRPMWSIVAEKVLMYAFSVMTSPSSRWARIAMDENLKLGSSSPYTRWLRKWKLATGSSCVSQEDIQKDIRRSAIAYVLREKERTMITSFPLNMDVLTSKWFSLKPWVSDSILSKMFARFRCCNLVLGNRGYHYGGEPVPLCPLCSSRGLHRLNNEVNKKD